MYNNYMFQNNLSKLNNSRLRNELLNLPLAECTGEIGYVTTAQGDIVFVKGELPTDDTIEPIKYTRGLITDKMKSMAANDIIVCVGFGTGYILDELSSAVKSKIVIYEPDTKFLRFVFETIDLSAYLSDKRIFLSDSMEECIEFILKDYLDDNIEFVVSPILALFYKDETEEFSNKLYSNLKSKIVDVNTIKILSKQWVKNVINFMQQGKKYYSLQNFKWKFAGKTALILGAGPSLSDNIEKIKSMRDKFVIFAVNKTLKTLENNGIVPDFAVFADAKFVEKQYNLSEEYTSKLNIIADWKSENFIENLKSKNLIMYFSDNEMFLKKYAKDLDIQLFPSEQTTTLMALICANFMDFEKIYFCGFDLAFKDNQVYSDGETTNVENGEAIINTSKKHIVEVPSVTGNMVQTREDYSIFIKSVETIIKTRGLRNLYNITEFGALIEGMNYTSFDNINIYGEKPNVDGEISKLPICTKDFTKYLEIEKAAMINIHQNVIGRSPIGMVTKKIITNTTLLYEYMQLELIELSRSMGQTDAVDKFYSKCILALDNLLAMIG